MTMLLRAGFCRYLKSPLTWIVAAVLTACGAYLGFSASAAMATHLIPTVAFAVLISLSVGKEYSDRTVCNKVIAGHSKKTVYLSEYLLAATLCTVMLVLFFGAMLLSRPIDLSVVPLLVGVGVAVGCLLFHLAFVALFVLLSMLISNHIVSPIVSIVLILAVMFWATSWYETWARPRFYANCYTYVEQENGESVKVVAAWKYNPKYITGIRRDLYTATLAILPTGQMITYTQIWEGYLFAEEPAALTDAQSRNLLVLPLCSLGLITAASYVGSVVFEKRDLK